MISAKSVTAFTCGHGSCTFETEGPQVRIWFLNENIVRIRASFDGRFDEESYALVLTAWPDHLDSLLATERRRVPAIDPVCTETNTSIELKTDGLKVVVTKSPFAVSVFDADGNLLHKDLSQRAYIRDASGRVRHYAEQGGHDHYYGFGETSGHLDKAGKRIRLSPKDAIGYDAETTSCLYKHIPFFVKLDADSRKAAGIYVHTPWDIEFDMGSEISGYWPKYWSFVADGGDVDFFVINGPSIADVVERYMDLTGKTVMPTKASLGYLGSTMYYVELEKDCDDAIIGFVNKNLDEDIPIDGFQLSSGYTVGPGNKRYVFTWNTTRFKDPEDFFAQMNEKGVPVSPNIKPGILLTHPHYDAFADQGGFIKTADGDAPYVDRWWGGFGSFVDFTSPRGREVWKNFIISSLSSKGVSSIWNDNCEFEINDETALCDADGAPKPAVALRSMQANLMSLTSHMALAESRPGERPYVICRSGGAGIQRYAQTWAGDNRTCFKTLKYNIAMMLGMSLSGVANQGCDVGGFAGPCPGPELFIRWVQNGIFQPRFSIHSCNDNNTVTEPWMYGEMVTEEIRAAIKFRYQLFPYFYALMAEANATGAPILRPLIYAFQDDPHCDGEDTTFMVGPSLLVANVVEEKATTRSVYLPAGCDWIDWWTHERYSGGQTITLDVDLDSIPMFVKDGAIVPTAPLFESISREKVKDLEILITPGQDAHFTLYEDDGVSNAYKDGVYLKTHIALTAGERVTLGFSHEGFYESDVKTVTLEVYNEKKGAFWVSVAGKRIDQYLDEYIWEKAETGWYYDAATACVRIRYPRPASDYEVVVSFEKFDLIGMDDD